MALPGHQHGPGPHCCVWAKCCGLNHSPKKSSMRAQTPLDSSVSYPDKHEAFKRSANGTADNL